MTKNEQEFKNMLQEVNSITRRLSGYCEYYEKSIQPVDLVECKSLNTNVEFNELQALLEKLKSRLS